MYIFYLMCYHWLHNNMFLDILWWTVYRLYSDKATFITILCENIWLFSDGASRETGLLTFSLSWIFLRMVAYVGSFWCDLRAVAFASYLWRNVRFVSGKHAEFVSDVRIPHYRYASCTLLHKQVKCKSFIAQSTGLLLTNISNLLNIYTE